MVYYDLLSMNVNIDNCKRVVKTVLETLTNRQIDRLPQKSVAATMMVEARLLAQMQASEAMLQGDCNVLHTDGTKLRFEELSLLASDHRIRVIFFRNGGYVIWQCFVFL